MAKGTPGFFDVDERRFLGLGLADAVPDANTIWTFHEALKKADAIDALFQQFDASLRDAGFLAMSGQIVRPRRRIALPQGSVGNFV